MKEYDIILKESSSGMDIRVASSDTEYPDGFREIGTLKAESYADACRQLKQRLFHDITERWVSL